MIYDIRLLIPKQKCETESQYYETFIGYSDGKKFYKVINK